MPKNNIRVERTRLGLSQGAVAKAMPDNVEAVALGFIENGRVLPTKGGMKALCDLFGCNPEDLYDPSELDLTLAEPEEDVSPPDIAPAKQTRTDAADRHEGMQQFRVWLRPQEKEYLERVVTELGYRSSAEWLREMYRNTIARYKRLTVAATNADKDTEQGGLAPA